MESLYRALSTLPFADEHIVLLVDGDDSLLGEFVFQQVNAKYNEKNILFTYGQYITDFGVLGNFMPYLK